MANPSIWDIIKTYIGVGQMPMASSTPVVIASDQSALDVNVVGGGDAALVTAVYGTLSVTTSPVIARVGGSNYANRVVLTVEPVDGKIWFGYDSAVDSTTGTAVFNGDFLTISATPTLDVYLVSAGTVDVRITEGANV